MHGSGLPSPWVERFAPLVTSGGSARSNVLDLACGGGRHGRRFLENGHKVCFLDRDLSGVADLRAHANADLIEADVENGPWPLAAKQFDAVVVTNYLWRPLFPQIAAALAPKGVLIYETFMRGNERFGKPSNPDFLLAPHELLDWCREAGFEIRAFEQGEEANAVRQRICAVRPA
ncbi:class I SAM-dependent methyltransferase [Ferrovibrio terrae]|uniref:Class I SAM-dependent methyltransferase n=1 Tax=Ferrovibrio terrae TaxID=2594003 RepID=A0A516H226_9PROT|nr:class I SAM-dependent methyltransferase [Ferrovibrio terrae]QDO97829.1 class I SAM-dependent methyltransferase [Ferrovibrio terrae]